MVWAAIGLTTFEAVVATTAIVGVGTAVKGAHDAKKAGKAAAGSQTALNRLTNAQAKRDWLRKFRQLQADAILQGVAAGVGLESSLVQGQLQSQSAQKTQGLKDFAEADRLGASIIGAEQRGADARSNAAIGGTVASFAAQFISLDAKTTVTPDGN